MTEIKNYYLLCTARLGSKSHFIGKLPEAEFKEILTKREIIVFLRRINNEYIAKEFVVGGNAENAISRGAIII